MSRHLTRPFAWLIAALLVLAPVAPLYAAAFADGGDHAAHAAHDKAAGCTDHVQCDRACAGCGHCPSALVMSGTTFADATSVWRTQAAVSHAEPHSSLFLHPPQVS